MAHHAQHFQAVMCPAVLPNEVQEEVFQIQQVDINFLPRNPKLFSQGQQCGQRRSTANYEINPPYLVTHRAGEPHFRFHSEAAIFTTKSLCYGPIAF